MALTPEVAAVVGAVSGFSFGVVVLLCYIFLIKPRLDKRRYEKNKENAIPSITFSREESIPNAVPVKVQPNGFFSFMRKKQKDEPPGEKDYNFSTSGVVYPIDLPDVKRGSVKILPLGSQDEDSEACSDVDPVAVKMSCLLAPQFRAYSEGMDIINYDEDIFPSRSDGVVQDCNLEFTLFYNTETRELHITVLQLTAMPTPRGPFRRYPNSCVKIRIVPNPDLHWQRTREIKGTLDPVFNETFVIPGFAHNKLREYTVHFVVLDYDEFLNNVTIIGEVNHPLSDLRAKRLMKVTRRVAKSYK